jgi:hypothetical protein
VKQKVQPKRAKSNGAEQAEPLTLTSAELRELRVKRGQPPADGAYWLAANLDRAAHAQPDDTRLNLAARVAHALAVALREPPPSGAEAALRKAAGALAKLTNNAPPMGLGHVTPLANLDRHEARAWLLEKCELALRMAKAGRPTDAALLTYTSARRVVASADDAREREAPLSAIWIERYVKRDAPTARGIGERALQAHGLSREQAKDWFRG